jgi:hypothetical protein
LAHKDVKYIKVPREIAWSRSNTIYRVSKNKRVVRVTKGLSSH